MDRDPPVFSKHPTKSGQPARGCLQVCVTVSFHTWDLVTLNIPGSHPPQFSPNSNQNGIQLIHQNGKCTFQLIDVGETCKETYHTWNVWEIAPDRYVKMFVKIYPGS